MLHVIHTETTTFVTHNTRTALEYEQKGYKVLDRNTFKSFQDAQQAAAEASEATGEYYIAVYHANMLPRYDVIRAPHMGDKVSKAFNGDYYPEGEIVKISPSLKRVETSTGEVFYRKKNTGTWLASKTWSLIPGHVDERNPHF